MQLYFARHGQTPSSVERRLRADDESLSSDGIAEVEHAARKLKEELGAKSLRRIVVSTRARTKETAKIFARILGFDTDRIEENPQLIERDCTPYAGQLVADVFSQSEAELVAGGMEPEIDVYQRTKELYDATIKTATENDIILLVGHSTALKPLAQIINDLPYGSAVDVPKVQPDNVWQLL